MNKLGKIGIGVVGTLVGLGVIGAIASPDDKKVDSTNTPAAAAATPTETAAPAVVITKGKLGDSFLIGGDKEARQNLHASKVGCYWDGDHVKLSITFTSTFGAHVTVHVQPNYRLKNAGLHGDGLTSQKDIGLDAGEVRAWVGDLGSPSGVDGTPAITECSPEINSVDLG